MAGHSKWSKIKRKKAATDGAQSRVFSKFSNLIAAESKKANGDTTSPGVRAVIERARAVNMPKDSIERAVKKGTAADAKEMTAVLFETYGPNGIAILIDALTDNNNRTAPEIKHLLSKQGCELAAPGSAAWAFTKDENGYTAATTVELSDDDAEKLAAIVDALEEHDDVQEVYTNAA